MQRQPALNLPRARLGSGPASVRTPVGTGNPGLGTDSQRETAQALGNRSGEKVNRVPGWNEQDFNANKITRVPDRKKKQR